MVEFPHNASFFLFGPRSSGKSTLVRKFLIKQKHLEVNLLLNKVFLKYNKDPDLFRKEVLFAIQEHSLQYVFVDEIQKIPALLDEIHQLIEETSCRFILSGSSARKIIKSHSNMLGGRALLLQLYPLNFEELKSHFSLNRVLELGSLAGMYFEPQREVRLRLKTYVETYLKEEIAVEGLVRNLGQFHRFLDLCANYSCEILNYENIAREGSIPAKTVAGYFDIVEDTLIGYRLPAWNQSVRKQLAKHPKFYLFDNGVNLAIMNAFSSLKVPSVRGRFFEQWLINEIRSFIAYSEAEIQLFYWRTLAGNEVDLILSKHQQPIAAIEIKAMKRISFKELSGLKSFLEEHPKVKYCILLSEVEQPYEEDRIQILPWRYFLTHILKNIISS